MTSTNHDRDTITPNAYRAELFRDGVLLSTIVMFMIGILIGTSPYYPEVPTVGVAYTTATGIVLTITSFFATLGIYVAAVALVDPGFIGGDR